jgi:hypothetical protein
MTELIYIQLLELYAFDLEVELLAEKLNNARPMTPYPSPVYQPVTTPQPWPYHPPWIVTCGTNH